ncbi:MAG: hypothetical protein BroJett026_39540 [Betaproteobacteria bacterium]|nr:MAG: hypothetical protein BroJett026_39540 [Betaproteobacteria bacterium]
MRRGRSATGRRALAVEGVVALSALLAILLFLPVQRGALLSDDYSLMFAFHGAGTATELATRVAQTFVQGVGAPSLQYRPVTMATFAFNVARGDADPLHWHAVSLLLHAANAALLAALVLRVQRGATGARAAALTAGLALALFPPAVEAVAWPAARFDALALFFVLAAARLAASSERALDGPALAALGAFALALGSKEAGILALPLAGALLWQREARARGVVHGAFAALPALLPWLAVAAAYFALRAAIFGDAVRFFPGASPMDALASGAFLDNAAAIAAWWPQAFPEADLSPWFLGAAAVLAVLGVRASLAERERAAEFVPLAAAAAAAFTILSAQWHWPAHGEGARVLYAVGAIAIAALVVPLRAASAAARRVALLAAAVMIVAGGGLAHGAVARWADAGASMRALIEAIERTAAALPAGEYAFVVAPDHVGPVPFARNAQAALLMPPVQPRELSSRILVQVVPELGQWTDLIPRDVIGRLTREPLIDVIRTLHGPQVAPPYRLPDRWFCWRPRERVLQPVALAVAADLHDWDAAWRRALDGPCAGLQQ